MKKFSIIAIVLFVVVGGFLFTKDYLETQEKENIYFAASAHERNGNYEESFRLFDSLRNYKDAVQRGLRVKQKAAYVKETGKPFPSSTSLNVRVDLNYLDDVFD